MDTTNYRNNKLWKQQTMETTNYGNNKLQKQQTIETINYRNNKLWKQQTIETTNYWHKIQQPINTIKLQKTQTIEATLIGLYILFCFLIISIIAISDT